MERSEFETTRAVTRRASLAPTSDEKPFLIGIAGEHSGRFFPLEGLREIHIGRTSDCEIPVPMDDIVSRRHARIEISTGGEVRISDLNSTNGTLVNGREVSTAVLRRGDRIFVGQSTIFKFDFLSEEERAKWASASVDALTEVFNRAYCDARLAELYEMACQRDRTLSVVMIDVDHFKQVNDTHGHQAGDFALQQVAATIDDWLVRSGVDGFTCRYGGEEFVVLLPGCGAQEAYGIADGMREAIAASPFEFEGTSLRLTVSAGTATFAPRNYDAPDRVLRAADENLYRAKHQGRNRVVGGDLPAATT